MNANQMMTSAAPVAMTAPYTVGNFNKGECRSDLQKEWIARPADQRFLNLSDLREFCFDRYQRSTESRVDTRGVEFIAPETITLENQHQLSVGVAGREIAPTNWSFGQVCRLASAPQSYLKTLPSPLVADALNYSLRYSREVESVKLYHDNDQLMAATGPDYGRIFDYELVDAVRQIAGNGTGDQRWKIPGMLDWATMKYDPDHPVSKSSTTLYASDRDVYIFLVDDRNPIEVGKLPNGDPDYLFRGFYCKNSEFGNGLLIIATFFLRGICCNRLLWGVTGFEQVEMVHSKLAPSRFIEEVRPALVSYADSSTVGLVEAVNKVKAAKIADTKEEALAWLNGRGLSRKRSLAAFEACEREEQREVRTVWDAAQGITAIARNEPNTDTRIELETVAKTMLEKVAA